MCNTVEAPMIRAAYREWLLGRVDSAVDNDCATFRSFRNLFFAHFCDVVEGWPRERAAQLVRSLVKYWEARWIQPIPLTEEEQEVQGVFSWPIRSYSTPGLPQITIDYPSRQNVSIDANKRGTIELRRRQCEGDFKVTKRKLKRAVLASLRPILGEPYDLNGTQLFWVHRCGYTIETNVNLAGSLDGQMKYWQLTYRGDVAWSNRNFAEELIMQTSFSDMLDGPRNTTWDCLTDADIEPTAELLATIARSYVEAFPRIIESARVHQVDSRGSLCARP